MSRPKKDSAERGLQTVARVGITGKPVVELMSGDQRHPSLMDPRILPASAMGIAIFVPNPGATHFIPADWSLANHIPSGMASRKKKRCAHAAPEPARSMYNDEHVLRNSKRSLPLVTPPGPNPNTLNGSRRIKLSGRIKNTALMTSTSTRTGCLSARSPVK